MIDGFMLSNRWHILYLEGLRHTDAFQLLQAMHTAGKKVAVRLEKLRLGWKRVGLGWKGCG